MTIYPSESSHHAPRDGYFGTFSSAARLINSEVDFFERIKATDPEANTRPGESVAAPQKRR